GKISDIDADKDINLVNVQDDQDMFDVNNDLGGEEVLVEKEVDDKDVNAIEEVNTASIATSPKAKGIIMQEPSEATTTTTIIPSIKSQDKAEQEEEEERFAREKGQQQLEANIAWDDVQAKIKADCELDQRLKFFAAKREVEKRNRPPTKAQQRKQESTKKQRIEDDNESVELKKCLEIIPDDGDDVTIDSTPLTSKSPTIVDYKIYKEGKKSYF
nr:hypothetical protein [Tanacetum cinerariifolium]